MNKKEIYFLDLFAGSSALSEGFIQNGFTPVAHIEMDKDACFTIKTRMAFHYLKKNNKLDIYAKYLKNIISREELYRHIDASILDSIINIEISDNTIDLIFDKIGKYNKKIDLIVGGPPCQAYSLLGRYQKNIENDPRTLLYIQYGKFLTKFSPKAFVFENVPGLLTSKKGKHFKEIKTYFKKLGYKITYKLLDASDYGVVQARKRLIIIGCNESFDLKFPNLDKVTNSYNVADAIYDLPKLKPGEAVDIVEYAKPSKYLDVMQMSSMINFTTQHIARPHNERDLNIYKKAITYWDKKQKRLKYTDLPDNLKTHKNENAFIDRFKVVNGKGLSHTIVAHIAKDGHYYIHPDIKQCRSLSVREAARIQSFSDDFYFEGSRSSAFKQIGNAVPPLMAYAIANKIKELL